MYLYFRNCGVDWHRKGLGRWPDCNLDWKVVSGTAVALRQVCSHMNSLVMSLSYWNFHYNFSKDLTCCRRGQELKRRVTCLTSKIEDIFDGEHQRVNAKFEVINDSHSSVLYPLFTADILHNFLLTGSLSALSILCSFPHPPPQTSYLDPKISPSSSFLQSNTTYLLDLPLCMPLADFRDDQSQLVE